MQRPTSKTGKFIKRLVQKLMSSMRLNWEHMKSRLSLKTKGRSAYHRHYLWFYPIILKPLKNVVESDVCWIQSLLTVYSPMLSWVFSYLCRCLVTVTKQNCFDGTKKETKARRLNRLPHRCQSAWLSKMQSLVKMAAMGGKETFLSRFA